MNQIEFNPYCCDEDILKACEEHGIIVQAYSPIGSGTRIGARGESKLGMYSEYRYRSTLVSYKTTLKAAPVKMNLVVVFTVLEIR